MWHKNSHCTDNELLLAADKELSPRQAAAVAAHLATCSDCQVRLDQIRHSANESVQAYHLERNWPPSATDPRASLQSLLKQEAEGQSAPASMPLLGWTWVYASIGVLLVCFAAYLWPHLDRSTRASSDRAPLVPSANLTPGVARPISSSQACLAGPLDQMSTIPMSVRKQVFSEYGMDDRSAGNYEVDHLITPELGGTDDIRNLWPEPYSSEWNARVKDRLEDHLRELVCQGKLDVSTAQRDIATDWISAYKKYFQTDKPRISSAHRELRETSKNENG